MSGDGAAPGQWHNGLKKQWPEEVDPCHRDLQHDSLHDHVDDTGSVRADAAPSTRENHHMSHSRSSSAPSATTAGVHAAGAGTRDVATGSHAEDIVILDHTGYVGHGNTVAAWTCLGTISLGLLVALIGFVMTIGGVLMWVGVAIMVIGLILGGVLKAMGMGYEGEVRKHERGELKH